MSRFNTRRISDMAKKAGADRVSGLVREEIEGTVRSMLEAVLEQIQTRNTVGKRQVEKVVKTMFGKGIEISSKRLPDCTKMRSTECFFISSKIFDQVLDELNFRGTEGAITYLHFWSEVYITSLLQDSLVLMRHAGRRTLFPKDISLVKNIRAEF